MSFDRFIRPFNPNVFSFAPKEYPTTEIPLEADRLYSRILTRTLLGFDPDIRPFPSVFSRPVRHLPSPFDPLPLPDCPPEEPGTSLQLTSIQAILDGVGLKMIEEVPTRPADALGRKMFVEGLANTIYATIFSKDFSQWQNQEMCKIKGTEPLTHLSVVDPNTYTLMAADKGGTLHHIQGNRVVGVAHPRKALDRVVDIFGRDHSTMTFGTQSGHITQFDLRTQRALEFETKCRPTSLDLHSKKTLLAAGSDRSVAIFDLRFHNRPVVVQEYPSANTSLAWDRRGNTLFAAFGGDEPTLTMNSLEATLSPITTLKTYGVVRSILCTQSHEDLVILREHKQGKCFVMLHRDSAQPSKISCTGISNPLSECLSPSSGVMETEDNGCLASFASSERFIFCQIQKPQKEPEPLLPNPYCIR